MREKRYRRTAASRVTAGLAAIGLAAGGCSSVPRAGDRPRGAPTTAGATTTSSPARTTTTAVPRAPFPVVSTEVTVTRGARRFGVEVLYPRPSSGRPIPLVVFSPGYDIDPGVYGPLVTGWASLGLVVAVPDYPYTSPGTPGGVDEADIVNHPADLEATIDDLLAVSGPAAPFSRMIDPARIAVAGHSDGAVVADAAVADSCCADRRIRAAAILSGSELTSFRGTYGPAPVPLLVIQGDTDTINPPACSEQI
ncbi:MAG TPA: hypothetical protein VKI19_09480, partial [Acidimicrobiales bacterium]|nr:hypothetical protein [Acidimicrobiales bacterium]